MIMEIAGNSLSVLGNNTTAQEISVAVLKKALDGHSEAAKALIEAIPQPPSPSGLPPSVGQNINTTA